MNFWKVIPDKFISACVNTSDFCHHFVIYCIFGLDVCPFSINNHINCHENVGDGCCSSLDVNLAGWTLLAFYFFLVSKGCIWANSEIYFVGHFIEPINVNEKKGRFQFTMYDGDEIS